MWATTSIVPEDAGTGGKGGWLVIRESLDDLVGWLVIRVVGWLGGWSTGGRLLDKF